MGSRTKHFAFSTAAAAAIVAAVLLLISSEAPAASQVLEEGVEAAMNTISSQRIRAHL